MHLLAINFALDASDYGKIAAMLIVAVLVYLGYKILWHPDFGMPVQRKLFARGMRVKRDQLCEVPIWWSNIQVQRAIRSHWKQTLRRQAGTSG
jgi:hypothetical protein